MRLALPWRAAAFLLLAGFVVLPATARADPWEKVRRGVIDPLNSELHRHLPRYLRERDLGAIVDLYEAREGGGIRWAASRPVYGGRGEEMLRWDAKDTGPEPIAERYRKILELFPTIEKAEVRIHRVHWDGEGTRGYPAELHLIVRGSTADGRRGILDQWADASIVAREAGWRITREEVVARDAVFRREPAFERVEKTARVSDVHESAGSPPYRLIGNVFASSGSAVADVDGDGCEDLVLAGSPKTALYRNTCDGRFAEATAKSGLPEPFPTVPTGVVFFDYDGDGDPDLWVVAVKGGNRLFRNDGRGRFEDVTTAAGDLSDDGWSSMPAVSDYDRDGDLDVFVVRMGDHERKPPDPNYQAENGRPDQLFRNEGDGTFTEVGARAGVADTGWGLAGAWADYDDDGWPDVYVANEFGFNRLYRNRGDGTFEEVSRAAGAADRGAGMGVSWGDYDSDGDLDLYVSNMYANSRWALFHPEFPVPMPWWAQVLRLVMPGEVRKRGDEIIHELTRGSTLLRNDGDGKFTDVSEMAGVRDAQWGWGAEFVDYDNDGWLDVYAVNGFVTGKLPDDV